MIYFQSGSTSTIAMTLAEKAISGGTHYTFSIQNRDSFETTVFAPTDEAFAKIPNETLTELLKPENKDALSKILTYHVTPGKLTAADVVKLNGKEIKMVNGDKAKIEVKNNEVYINGAKIIVTDIMAKRVLFNFSE